MDEPVWREMLASDLDGVVALAREVHPAFEERAEVFADRLAIFPAGCQVLFGESGVEGYAVSHPAKLRDPPPLGAILGALPTDADGYYIHDVVVAPRLRGAGHARIGVYHALDAGAAFRETGLVAIRGTVPFWERFGFTDASRDVSAEKLLSYGEGARYLLRRKRAVEFTPRAG
ncbi:GNAT family N-acetyltransferase [Aureimonas leprariae]|uniref:GNAT family N-acetyltransferase n=1 Tax=Plantimonas leprariae TaxID=2615207 RepID=A0A7V7PQI9_9HYPH|nr:GNAT family N-acetyltransferase [Aureimonas leprariae]KAB0680402.1 GNAT family N-acetyltransferase [Aureimonas leprariae]